eukprot:CAMPEP_0197651504 /NCGR_PEP_ID=MMETSP1338-20131121/32835_1 /TAXON_ID=43686 ORGANISM="Pelagodinium beii, Strain RCC1491" /NCGR_SAMPLE_ID=MMETSP1338 /ASSEMBLY_ACC=CAM_ASM_000754 /LENGTH=90 /DNA_ID=CAMNT_0043226157 /DNA_START=56 /DNA_END=328 /DNA_ORIENTATION=+
MAALARVSQRIASLAAREAPEAARHFASQTESKAAEKAKSFDIKKFLHGPMPVILIGGVAVWYVNRPVDSQGNLKQTSVSIRLFGPNMPL